MRYFRIRARSRRFLLVSAVVGVVVLGGTAIALGAPLGYPTDSVTVMTGCLTTSGTGAGNVVNIAANPTTPTKACGSNQKLVHLSGGTITRVTAGTGLGTNGSGGTGGTNPSGQPYIDNGFAALGLLPGFALPQACSPGQFPDWGGSVATGGTGTWGCGTAQNTTYTAGTGLDLSSGAFSIKSAYQLPQNCTSGQIPDWGGQAWSCANDQNTTYSGKDFATSGQDCPAHQFATGIDGNGNLKCAQPSLGDLRGSACNFNGHPSTLTVSTDNTTGDVSLKCQQVWEVSATATGLTKPTLQIFDVTTNVENNCLALTCSLLVHAGDQVSVDLFSDSTPITPATPFNYTCPGEATRAAVSQQDSFGMTEYHGICPLQTAGTQWATVTSDYAVTAAASG